MLQTLLGEKNLNDRLNSIVGPSIGPKPNSPLPITTNALDTQRNSNSLNNTLPSNGLQTSEETQKMGSLVDFQKVARAISQNTYTSRQKKEGKVTKGQFDPSKVSGSTFKSIMSGLEANRGGDISKMYSSTLDANTEQTKLEEQKRQFNVEQDSKQFDLIKQKTELGLDSIYIPSGTLASRNNNPGNLRFVGQLGATQGDGGFAKFNSPEEGYQALINQIQLDQSRGLTLAQFVNKYAPPTENNTNLYVKQMAQWMGVNENMLLSDIDINTIAENVARKESGTKLVKGSSLNDVEIDSLAKKYKSGEITAAQIPAAKRGLVFDAASKLGQIVSPEQKSVMMNNVSIVDEILTSPEKISGVWGGAFTVPFTEGWQKAKEYEQLQGILKLDKRQMLKGQGAISDFEFKVLGDAASSISRLSSEQEFKEKLQEIKGVFTTAAGEKARVKVSKGGESHDGFLSRDEITDAISQGFIVKYI